MRLGKHHSNHHPFAEWSRVTEKVRRKSEGLSTFEWDSEWSFLRGAKSKNVIHMKNQRH